MGDVTEGSRMTPKFLAWMGCCSPGWGCVRDAGHIWEHSRKCWCPGHWLCPQTQRPRSITYQKWFSLLTMWFPFTESPMSLKLITYTFYTKSRGLKKGSNMLRRKTSSTEAKNEHNHPMGTPTAEVNCLHLCLQVGKHSHFSSTGFILQQITKSKIQRRKNHLKCKVLRL